MALILSDIKQLKFPENQYFKEVKTKNQIVLHHTASGRGIDGDFSHWLNTPSRIATCVIVGHDGQIYQLFSSKFWGHHLGIKNFDFIHNDIPLKYRKNSRGVNFIANNDILNESSIAIEIDSWGQLTEKNGKFYSYTGAIVPKENVVEYPDKYRGFKHYEAYTPKQIEAVKNLIEYWSNLYNIDITYNQDMWDVSKNALSGKPGVWSHTSFRKDKNDIHPQKELVEMLKSLR